MLRTALLLLVAVAGCNREAAIPVDVSPQRYSLRNDLMPIGDLGAPPKWPSAGYPPMRTARLGTKSPDAEFASLLGPKLASAKPAILDPQNDLTPAQRDILLDLLDSYFGSPAAPTVKLPDAETAKKLEVPAAILKEATAAKSALLLEEESLSKGAVLYRRWCLQCHGPTGGGDGAHAVAMAAMPRDYRKGLFKFITCFPIGTPRSGELGKARRDDLKRTIHNGLDGSMMPAFPQFSDADLDDLASYVMHLSIRGESEFELISRTISLVKNPRDDDPEFSREFAEGVLANKLALTVGNWKRADDSKVPIPPDPVTNDADRLLSAVRGYKSFLGTCAGCHQDFGRGEQLKFDLWGTVVQPRNLVLGVYRGGRRGEDLYARIYGGIYASTMPDSKSKAEGAKPGDPDGIWDVVHFLQMLADPRGRKLLQKFDKDIKLDP